MPNTTLSSGHLRCLECIAPPGVETSSYISSVKNAGQISYYGKYQTLIHDKLQRFSAEVDSRLNRASNVAPETSLAMISEIFLTFLQIAHSDCLLQTPENASACWLTARITNADTNFQIPRWHQDGRMFDTDTNSPSIRSKYATTLLGPTTLLLDLPQTAEMMEYLTFNDDSTPLADSNDWTLSQLLETEEESLHFREKVAKFFSDKGFEPVPVQPGQVVRFSWGHDFSPVHSEPNSSESDRVFISVLFGSESEIELMAETRDITYETWE